MKLYYHKCLKPNFGDEINTWFWKSIFGADFDGTDDSLFAGIGTILNDRLPDFSTVHVFGSGAGYGSYVPTTPPGNWKFHCVRGPLTAKTLGLDPSLSVSDPAILLPRIFPVNPSVYDAVSFIPHIGIDSKLYQSFVNSLGVNYISPTWPDKEVVTQIASSKYVITSAMHGAIIADAYRVPWYPLVTSNEILDFKWLDWCDSLDLIYKPTRLPPLWELTNSGVLTRVKTGLKKRLIELRLRELIAAKPFFLSDEGKLNEKQDRLLEIAEQFKKHYLK